MKTLFALLGIEACAALASLYIEDGGPLFGLIMTVFMILLSFIIFVWVCKSKRK